MLGPISLLNTYGASGVLPVAELPQEGIQSNLPVNVVQPNQPTSGNQSVTSDQQDTTVQKAVPSVNGKPQTPKPNGGTQKDNNSKAPAINGHSKAGLTPPRNLRLLLSWCRTIIVCVIMNKPIFLPEVI